MWERETEPGVHVAVGPNALVFVKALTTEKTGVLPSNIFVLLDMFH